MTTFTSTKDPQSKVSHKVDWAAEMALTSPADTISTSTWTADNGLIIVSDFKSNTTATVTIRAGRLGAYCNLTNHIITASGGEYDATVVMEIKQK